MTMNILNKALIAAALATVAAPCSIAQTSQRLTADKTNEYGLIYTLPSTNVEITVCIERTVRQPGQFHNYARKYLNVSDAIMRTDESVKVTQVVLNSFGVADPSKRYLAQFKNGSTPFMNIGPENAPLNINTEETYIVPTATITEPEEPEENPLDTEAARQAITQEMIQSFRVIAEEELEVSLKDLNHDGYAELILLWKQDEYTKNEHYDIFFWKDDKFETDSYIEDFIYNEYFGEYEVPFFPEKLYLKEEYDSERKKEETLFYFQEDGKYVPVRSVFYVRNYHTEKLHATIIDYSEGEEKILYDEKGKEEKIDKDKISDIFWGRE